MSVKNLLLSLTCVLALGASAPADVYKALLVGCDEWANDVHPMKHAMLAWDTVYWHPSDIVVMKHACGDEVLAQIGAMLAPGDTDFFFFAYTGHGATGRLDGQLESVPPALNDDDEWLCTPSVGASYDQWLSDDDLTLALEPYLFGCKFLVALDSCHSGGFWNGNDQGGLEGDLEWLLPDCALYASCAEDEISPLDSPMWWALRNGCQGGAADVFPADDIITVGEWYDFADPHAPLSEFWGNMVDTPVFAIPEPSALSLLALGGLTLLRRRKA